MAYIRQAWMYYVTMKLQQNAENITIIFPFDGLTHLYFYYKTPCNKHIF